MKITIGEKDIEVGPLTISQYEMIQSGKEMNDIETLSYFTGIPISEIKKADYQQIIFVTKFLMAYLSKEMEDKNLLLSLEYKGEKLGLLKPSQMSYGEYSDLHVLMSEEKPDYRRICAILYRPLLEGGGEDRVIEEYDYDKCLARSKDMGDFPLKNYFTSIFFLTMYNNELLKASPLSSERGTKQKQKNPMTEQEKKN